MSESAFSLDIRRMRFSEDGLDGFCWPIDYDAFTTMKWTALAAVAELVRDMSAAEPAQGRVLRIVGHAMIVEALTLYQGQALVEALGSRFLQGRIPESYRVWPALAAGEPPQVPAQVGALARAFPKKGVAYYFAKYGNRLCRLFVPDQQGGKANKPSSPRSAVGRHIPSGHISSRTMRRQIVCTKRGSLQQCHAAMTDDSVRYFAHNVWFRPVGGHVLRQHAAGRVKGISVELLSRFEAAFEAGGLTMSSPVRSSLEQTALSMCTLASVHLQRLLGRPNSIPALLWTGSGGNLWDRMLQIAVREKGGHSTGHSHAGGLGYVCIPEFLSSELAACDEYAVFSQGEREQIVQLGTGDENRYLFGPVPKVTVLDCPRRAQRSLAAMASAPRRIMYVGSIYRGESMALGVSRFNDPVSVDWQYRLFAHLRSRGMEVLVKPHPESEQVFCETAARELGVTVLDEYFERVMQECDVVIFDRPNTTAFNVAVLSDLPMVLVDFGQFKWCPGAEELVTQRVSMVRGEFDADNRAQVDWDALDRALEEAARLREDTKFVDRYVTMV